MPDDIRIKDILATATAADGDDYTVLDGATRGTRRILASNVGTTVLSGLRDVSVPAPVDQESLIWKASESRWVSNGVTDGGNF